MITDPVNGRSKSYGFVRFSSEEQRNRALKEMGGMLIAGKPIRVSLATAKKGPTAGSALGMPPVPGLPPSSALAGMVRAAIPYHCHPTANQQHPGHSIVKIFLSTCMHLKNAGPADAREALCK